MGGILKNIAYFAAVLVVGALLGSFLGEFMATSFSPDSAVHRLFSKQISAGLEPATLNLQILRVTIGCMLQFNMTSLIGMLFAAIAFKTLAK